MKCSRRSTRLLANVALLLLIGAPPLGAGSASAASAALSVETSVEMLAEPSVDRAVVPVVSTSVHRPVVTSPSGSDAAVAAAIARAVRLRVGPDAEVIVSEISGVRVAEVAQALIAVPEPAERVGPAMRFLLSDARPGRAPVRVGEATARVHVTVPAVRTTRPMARGERFAPTDVAAAAISLDGRPLRPLPVLDEAIGGRATRDLSTDTVLARADIATQPLVRAGDIVRTHARVGSVVIVGDMVAAESGGLDTVIRVINRETKKVVRARVSARGEVEVVNVR